MTKESALDGAHDDMSDGTPKTEASDLMDEGRDDEITPPLATDGLEADPLANSRDTDES